MPANTSQRRGWFFVVVLAGAVSTLSGCAALNPGPTCHCPKCEQQWQEDEQVLVDFEQGFRKYVLGTDFEEELPRERQVRQLKHGQIARQTSKVAAEPAIRTASNTAPVEVVETPAPATQGMPQDCAGMYEAPPAAMPAAACEVGPCLPLGPPPMAGPPPRFFPVPARPVFAPQGSPYGYPAPPSMGPTPMSNWGESTDASL